MDEFECPNQEPFRGERIRVMIFVSLCVFYFRE